MEPSPELSEMASASTDQETNPTENVVTPRAVPPPPDISPSPFANPVPNKGAILNIAAKIVELFS